MSYADWVAVAALLIGGGGLGGLVTALVTARGSVYKNLNDLVDQLQEDRKNDREVAGLLTTRVERVLFELHLEREYSTALLVWGMNGAPPPPPARQKPEG